MTSEFPIDDIRDQPYKPKIDGIKTRYAVAGEGAMSLMWVYFCEGKTDMIAKYNQFERNGSDAGFIYAPYVPLGNSDSVTFQIDDKV